MICMLGEICRMIFSLPLYPSDKNPRHWVGPVGYGHRSACVLRWCLAFWTATVCIVVQYMNRLLALFALRARSSRMKFPLQWLCTGKERKGANVIILILTSVRSFQAERNRINFPGAVPKVPSAKPSPAQSFFLLTWISCDRGYCTVTMNRNNRSFPNTFRTLSLFCLCDPAVASSERAGTTSRPPDCVFGAETVSVNGLSINFCVRLPSRDHYTVYCMYRCIVM